MGAKRNAQICSGCYECSLCFAATMTNKSPSGWRSDQMLNDAWTLSKRVDTLRFTLAAAQLQGAGLRR